jgi:hypothetical protein
MSEEDYIKVACYECRERISLPVDGVGVAFNCPHCGVDLQMLLKHICEHCGGRLSFEGKPEAIGVQIECGHCHQATALQPSTFAVDNAGARTEPATEEEYDEEEYDEEEYDEEEYDEEEYDEEEYDEEEPEAQVRRRVGPPKPRPPGGKGLPRPRPPKRAGSQEALRPGHRPAKIGRTLAGAGAKPKEVESSGGPRKRPRPKRKTRAQRSSVQPSSGPVGSGAPTRRIDGAPPESQEVDPMDPMSGVVPDGPSGTAGPVGPGPVQRKVAGADADGPQPTFKGSSSEDEAAGPWYENREKQTLVVVMVVFLFVFIPFGLPNFVKIFDLGLGNKIERIVKLKFLFTEGDYRNNPSDDVQVDPDSIKIQPIDENSSTTFVIGEAKNTSSETLRQVELHFNLYDSSGQKVGEAMDYKEEMGPNTPWNLKAACQFTDPQFTNAVRADLVEVIVR